MLILQKTFISGYIWYSKLDIYQHTMEVHILVQILRSVHLMDSYVALHQVMGSGVHAQHNW